MEFSPEQLQHFRETSERAARSGGAELLRQLGIAQVSEKGPGDLVTEADFASQAIIREIVSTEFPEHLFLGEEDDGSLDQLTDEATLCWVVDPLDGTLNFVHQLRSFSVSVALVLTNPGSNDRVIAGTVFDPLLNECYSAADGQGATLNESPIQVATETRIGDALLVCSFAGRSKRDSPEVARFLNILEQAQTVRRLGSAALNFCYLACGRIDGYWATAVKIWDVAAGVIILQEAGGQINSIEGEVFNIRKPRFVATGTPELNEILVRELTIESTSATAQPS